VCPLIFCVGFIDGLGDAVEQGLVKAVGVSNYNGSCSLNAFITLLKSDKERLVQCCEESHSEALMCVEWVS